PDAERDVLAANAAFYAAFAAKDTAAMEELWAQRVPVTCLHPGWNLLSGRDAVLESWRAILENPQQGRIVAGGATARLLGDAALLVGREVVAGNPLAATNVFMLEAGAWRLVHHQSGPVMQLD